MQTTMKIDKGLLNALRSIAKAEYRSPQQHLRFLVDREIQCKERMAIVQWVEASEALEGYEPLTEGFAYELEQQWIKGDISLEEKGRLLFKHHGLKYSK
ncbi:antitoxin VbhA family protein [Cardiobacterium sp. AH-315-I02]|nr:antitoxin VbhA family protein [Cardiobacterium sp. AH-315-I02]